MKFLPCGEELQTSQILGFDVHTLAHIRVQLVSGRVYFLLYPRFQPRVPCTVENWLMPVVVYNRYPNVLDMKVHGGSEIAHGGVYSCPVLLFHYIHNTRDTSRHKCECASGIGVFRRVLVNRIIHTASFFHCINSCSCSSGFST